MLKALWRFAAMAARDYLTDDENEARIAAAAVAEAAGRDQTKLTPGAALDTEDLLYDEATPSRNDTTKQAAERLFALMNPGGTP